MFMHNIRYDVYKIMIKMSVEDGGGYRDGQDSIELLI